MFHEDSRIVYKNRLHNIAYDKLHELRSSGLSDSEILINLNNLAPINDAKIRNDIREEIVKIIRRICESTTMGTGLNSNIQRR